MGRLFVVPTPIGNLEDITYRAVRVLGEVSIVYAEDTRHSRKLLAHYAISTPLRSYHQHNKRTRLDEILRALEDADIAVISSAGMPAISDPGFELVRAAVDRGFEVDVLPGPSAVITAVVGAALAAPGFTFLGFPPRKSGERREMLAHLADSPFSLVLYESPRRLVETLRDVAAVLGDREIVVARELTKVHQEYLRGTVGDVIAGLDGREPRGEVTIVIAPSVPSAEDPLPAAREDLARRWQRGEDRRSALTSVVREFGISRNAAYAHWLELSRDRAAESE